MRAKFFAPVAGCVVLAGLALSCGTVDSSHGRSPASPGGPPTAFVDVTVIPMDREQRLPHQTVLVRDGRIVQIGPSGSTPVPPEVRQIPGAGKFLVPGLTDAHFHLQSGADDERLLSLLLANGVTFLNLYGTPAVLDLRNRVARHELIGPTIYTSGPYISDAPRWQPDADE